MRLLLGLLVIATGCDRVLGVDPRQTPDSATSPNHGRPLECGNLRSLPTVVMEAAPTGSFGTGSVVSSLSVFSVGTQQLLLYVQGDVNQDPFLHYWTAPSPTAASTTAGFLNAGAKTPEVGTLWREANGQLALFHITAGVTRRASPTTDGTNGMWTAGQPISIPAGTVRSVGAIGQRVLVEIDEPHELVEYERDPRTDELVELETLATVNAAPGSPRHASLTADGCRLLVELDTGTLAVAVRDAEGVFGAPTEIFTDGERATWPVLSENGDFLYFVRPRPDGVRDELYVMQR